MTGILTRQATKFRLQLLESFLEYFRETVFDQVNLIHLDIQYLGDLWVPLLSSHPWDGQIPQANTDVNHLWQAAKD